MKQVFLVQAFYAGEIYTWGGLDTKEKAQFAAKLLDDGGVYDFTRITEAWIYDDVQVWADHEL
jgi:hypothetical protein